MNFVITGNETADELIKQLVGLRIVARRIVTAHDARSDAQAYWTRLSENAPDGATKAAALGELAALEERRLELNFAEIDIGRFLVHLCPELDKKVSRDALFDAISTSRADRDTEDVRKYGNKASHILFVLDLENSATKEEGMVTRPLKWCHTMAFMNAMSTSEKLAKTVHDGANEFFSGAFGEYREKPLMERLAGRSL